MVARERPFPDCNLYRNYPFLLELLKCTLIVVGSLGFEPTTQWKYHSKSVQIVGFQFALIYPIRERQS